MQIRLNNLLPHPLKEKIGPRSSDVWHTEVAFHSNEFTKIKAPSGTGKTTLLHYLYQIRHDFEGDIFYNEENVSSVSAERMATYRQQKLSIVFQDLRLFPTLTASDNIELNRILQTPFYEKEKIIEMAERLHIAHILHQPAAICSYGEQQRIAIIRALVQPFELLLMDEPFSHLDRANTKDAAALIAEECHKRSAGFVLTDLDDDNNFDYTQNLNL